MKTKLSYVQMESKTPYRLIAKHLGGETSATEDDELYAWLAVSEENTAEFEKLVLLYHQTGLINVNAKEVKQTYFKWWYAAASIGLLLAAYLIWKPADPISEKRISNNGLKPLEISIENQLTVWLNSYSAISYQISRDSIFVSVTGEAYFEHDEHSSLQLVLIHKKVRVLANKASFNYQYISKTTESIISVSEGQLTIIDESKGNLSIGLISGYSASLLNGYGMLSFSENENLNYQSWREVDFFFENESLNQLIGMVENATKTKIRFDDASIASKKITGHYQANDLKEMLQQVIQSSGLQMIQESDEIIIKS